MCSKRVLTAAFAGCSRRCRLTKAIRLTRQAAPDEVRRLIEMAELGDIPRRDDGSLLPLSSGADHRVVTVAANALIERAFGKPREYVLTAESRPGV
jgi:hypothetical protein